MLLRHQVLTVSPQEPMSASDLQGASSRGRQRWRPDHTQKPATGHHCQVQGGAWQAPVRKSQRYLECSKFSEAEGDITWREYSRHVGGDCSVYNEAEGNISQREYNCQVIQNKLKTYTSQSLASARLCFRVNKLIREERGGLRQIRSAAGHRSWEVNQNSL